MASGLTPTQRKNPPDFYLTAGLTKQLTKEYRMHRTVSTVSTLSDVFDDYTDEARERYEGSHVRVELHVTKEYARHLQLGRPVVLEVDEAWA